MQHIANTIKNTEESARIKILFWSLAISIVALSSLYMYFVNKTVWNVVAREHAESGISTLNSKLSDTEFQYINSVSAVTEDTAVKLGFVPADKSTTFVARAEIGKSVAIR